MKRRSDPLPMTAADLRRARVDLGLGKKEFADRLKIDLEHYMALASETRRMRTEIDARLGLVRIGVLLAGHDEPLAAKIKAIVKESLVT